MSPDEAGHGPACTEHGEKFIADWRDTGGSQPANTLSFINRLCQLPGVDAPAGSRTSAARGGELGYLPPYSPDLDPIEQMFGKLKALLRRMPKLPRQLRLCPTHAGSALDRRQRQGRTIGAGCAGIRGRTALQRRPR